MTYSHEVEHMCVVKKGPNHGPAPIPEEGKWPNSYAWMVLSLMGTKWTSTKC